MHAPHGAWTLAEGHNKHRHWTGKWRGWVQKVARDLQKVTQVKSAWSWRHDGHLIPCPGEGVWNSSWKLKHIEFRERAAYMEPKTSKSSQFAVYLCHLKKKNLSWRVHLSRAWVNMAFIRFFFHIEPLGRARSTSIYWVLWKFGAQLSSQRGIKATSAKTYDGKKFTFRGERELCMWGEGWEWMRLETQKGPDCAGPDASCCDGEFGSCCQFRMFGIGR